MTSEDVRRLIEAEVGRDWDRENAHGCTVRRCLVEPEKRSFSDELNDDTVDLWLVLEEDPEGRTGYKVVYDDVNESFGLAYPGFDGSPSFLGLYGSFLRAYDAM